MLGRIRTTPSIYDVCMKRDASVKPPAVPAWTTSARAGGDGISALVASDEDSDNDGSTSGLGARLTHCRCYVAIAAQQAEDPLPDVGR